MGTGVTATLLNRLPFQFPGLSVLADVVFGLNVVVFVVLLAATIARYILFPRLIKPTLLHPTQSLFIGTLPMGLATVADMLVYRFTSLPGGGGVRAARAAWWLWVVSAIAAAACAALVPAAQELLQQSRRPRRHEARGVTAAHLLPAIGPIVLAATGGVVASGLLSAAAAAESGETTAAADALPLARATVAASYALWGLGVPASLVVLAAYYRGGIGQEHRQPRHGRQRPPTSIAEAAVAMLAVGPCGRGAFGLLELAQAA
ncbi:Plasma membrane sulfite pump involved in sulfite metabolism, partial [Cladochytrium tenue]